MLQSVDQRYYYPHGALVSYQRVSFGTESIRIDVPSDGITVAEWKVFPLTNPSVVRRI